MATTIKRITLALSQGEIDQMQELMELLGENCSDIFKRALMLLHYITINKNDKTEDEVKNDGSRNV